MFTIIKIASQEAATDSAGRTLVFASGADAANAAKAWTGTTGDKYQPRKLASDDSWKTRERSRLESGEYRRACAALESVFVPDHFAHMSKKKAGEIAYTKDAAKGVDDKQSIISVRTYLETFAAHLSAATMESIIEAQAEADTELTPVLFATTADDIERVYTNYARQGFNGSSSMPETSCMRHESDHFSSNGIHPTRIYGAGDLAIAYLVNEEGETRARALCWLAKKVYGRVYGPTDELHVLLKAQGFEKSRGYYAGASDKDFTGARLLRIEYNYDSDYVIAPYLDEGNIDDYGDHLVITYNGGYSADSTNGKLFIGHESETTCDNCEEGVDEDDVSIVYTRSNRRGARSWCECCRDGNTFYCEATEETYSDEVGSTVLGDGRTVNDGYLSENCELCDSSEEWFESDEMHDVIVDDYGAMERWHISECERHATRDSRGDWYSEDVTQVEYVTRIESDSEPEDTEEAFGSDIENVAFKCLVDGRYYALKFRHPENPCVAICNYSPIAPYHCDDESQLEMELAA